MPTNDSKCKQPWRQVVYLYRFILNVLTVMILVEETSVCTGILNLVVCLKKRSQILACASQTYAE